MAPTENKPPCTLDAVIDQFQIRLDKIYKVIHLVHLTQDRLHKETLMKLEEDISQIEAMLTEMHCLMDQRSQQLSKFMILKKSLTDSARVLNQLAGEVYPPHIR